MKFGKGEDYANESNWNDNDVKDNGEFILHSREVKTKDIKL